VFTVY
jgi:hypothetical protein